MSMTNTTLKVVEAAHQGQTPKHPKEVADVLAKHAKAAQLFDVAHRDYAADLASLPVKEWDAAIKAAAAEHTHTEMARTLLRAGLYQRLDSELSRVLRAHFTDYARNVGVHTVVRELAEAVHNLPEGATLDYRQAVEGGYAESLRTILETTNTYTAISGMWGRDIAAAITTIDPIAVRRETRLGEPRNTDSERELRAEAQTLTALWPQNAAEALVKAVNSPELFAIAVPSSLADYQQRQANWANLKLRQTITQR